MTSKKLTLVLLASTVIFKSLSRKTLEMPYIDITLHEIHTNLSRLSKAGKSQEATKA